MNAFRLGAGCGTELIVGVNSDETIKQCKGPPVMSQDERVAMVRGCRFVAEVIDGTPYVMSQEYLNWVMEEYNIDYVIHGDDPCIVDGKDVYAHVKAMKKFKSIPRTEGVSTTDIVGRMLLCTTSHHIRRKRSNSRTLGALADEGQEAEDLLSGGDDDDLQFAYKSSSRFLTTSSMLSAFRPVPCHAVRYHAVPCRRVRLGEWSSHCR